MLPGEGAAEMGKKRQYHVTGVTFQNRITYFKSPERALRYERQQRRGRMIEKNKYVRN